MKYPEDIHAALIETGHVAGSIAELNPRQVFDFMLSKHGLAGWGDYLSGLAQSTIAATEPDIYEMHQPGSELPEHIGLAADVYSEVRAARIAAEKKLKPVKDREHELREHIISSLEKGEGKGAVGNVYKAVIKEERKPRITAEGWASFHAYIATSGRFDLLQKRMNDKAVMDMFEQDELPPGVETILVPKVSITKI